LCLKKERRAAPKGIASRIMLRRLFSVSICSSDQWKLIARFYPFDAILVVFRAERRNFLALRGHENSINSIPESLARIY
jgi:hypothetical protein